MNRNIYNMLKQFLTHIDHAIFAELDEISSLTSDKSSISLMKSEARLFHDFSFDNRLRVDFPVTSSERSARLSHEFPCDTCCMISLLDIDRSKGDTPDSSSMFRWPYASESTDAVLFRIADNLWTARRSVTPC